MSDPTPRLTALGWSPLWEERLRALGGHGLLAGRVAVEDKHHYVLLAEHREYLGTLPGRVLHQTASRADLPKVGDWVAFTPVPNEHKALIHHVLPRETRLSRKIPGRETEEQVMVANVSVCFIVQALNGLNPGLLHRHLLTVREGGVRPVVVLNKTDLCENKAELIEQAGVAAADSTVVPVCGITGTGVSKLARFIKPRETVVFIGSSGVGKSTLINQLCKEEVQTTTEVRESDQKGRHTTTWRELFELPNGGLVIDTPGMREFHLWPPGGNLTEAYPDVAELAVRCHFRDCSHTVEKRCAVLEALAAGTLLRERFDAYQKLHKEVGVLQTAQNKRTVIERRRKTNAATRALLLRRRDEAEE